MDNPITIDLSPQLFGDAEAQILENEDGSLTVDFDPASAAVPLAQGFGDNLAESIPRNELHRIAQDVLEWVKADEDARAPWRKRYEDGLKTAGIIVEADGDSAPFKGAATVVHPLLFQACVQFQSRAIAELFPPSGPVKGEVNGSNTDALMEQAQRVADFMNYQITQEDKTYFSDLDQLLMGLPLAGSQFKKTFYDPRWQTVRSVLCKAEDVLVPYTATSLHDTPRITHKLRMSHPRLMALVESGYYANTPMPEPMDEGSRNPIADKIDNVSASLAEHDAEHLLFECHCEMAIKGMDGDEIKPYIITVEEATQQTIGVRRNYDEADEQVIPELWFTHYKFWPGLGFYGFGYLHGIGGLGDAATGSLRAILDTAARKNHSGGFKARSAKLKGIVSPGPGEWVDTDMDGEELQKAFLPLPNPGDAGELVRMLELLVDAGETFTGSTDVMTGDANNNGPVGTTLALIEEANKPQTAIQKRLHQAQGEEFKLRFKLNSRHLPDEYPYAVGNSAKSIMRADFSDAVTVVPVSDPNIFSNTQRIALAQAVNQMAHNAPDKYDTYEADKMLLRAIRVPDTDIDRLLPDPSKIPHSDPVSEGSYLIIGKAIKAHLDEAHDAHIAVHSDQAQRFQSLPPAIGNRVLPALMAHIAEHSALAYRLALGQMMGLALPMLDEGSDRHDMPPELANALAVQAAQAVQLAQIQQQAQAQAQQQQAAEQQAQQSQQRQAQALAEKQQAHDAEQALKNQALQADLDREQVKHAADFLRHVGAEDVPPVALVQASQQLGKPFTETLALIRQQQAQGQGVGPFPWTEQALQTA